MKRRLYGFGLARTRAMTRYFAHLDKAVKSYRVNDLASKQKTQMLVVANFFGMLSVKPSNNQRLLGWSSSALTR